MSSLAVVETIPRGGIDRQEGECRRTEGGPPSLPGAIDLQSAVFHAMNLVRTVRSKTAMSAAESAGAKRDRSLAEARDATHRAEREEKEAATKGKWVDALRTIGTVAAVAVATASVVFSAGTSTPAAIALVGVVLSASSPYVAKYSGSETAGLTVALIGAGMSLGAGGYSLAASGAQAANTLSATGKAAMFAGRMTSASAEISQGSVSIARGDDEADAMEALADAKARRADAANEQAEVEEAIAVLQQVEASHRRAMRSILAIGDTSHLARGEMLKNMRRA